MWVEAVAFFGFLIGFSLVTMGVWFILTRPMPVAPAEMVVICDEPQCGGKLKLNKQSRKWEHVDQGKAHAPKPKQGGLAREAKSNRKPPQKAK